jgi:hypothetical protein
MPVCTRNSSLSHRRGYHIAGKPYLPLFRAHHNGRSGIDLALLHSKLQEFMHSSGGYSTHLPTEWRGVEESVPVGSGRI